MPKPKLSDAALDAIRDEIPDEVMSALMDRELSVRRERKIAERTEAADEEGKQPGRKNRTYKEIVSGVARRRNAPVATPEDRPYVAGALRWWRQAHGLTPAQAQARIGYSPKSSIWRHWEDGFHAPPYKALLMIIASTGMDARAAFRDPALGVDPKHRLDVLRTDSARRRRERRQRREERAAERAS